MSECGQRASFNYAGFDLFSGDDCRSWNRYRPFFDRHEFFRGSNRRFFDPHEPIFHPHGPFSDPHVAENDLCVAPELKVHEARNCIIEIDALIGSLCEATQTDRGPRRSILAA